MMMMMMMMMMMKSTLFEKFSISAVCVVTDAGVCVCVCVCGPGVCVLFNMSVLKLQEAAQTCPVS